MSSRQFSMATMIRMVPNALLEEFFSKLGHRHIGIPWKKVGISNIPGVLRAISWLRSEQQDRIESTLRTIFELACNKGIEAITEAAVLCGDLRLPRDLPSMRKKVPWSCSPSCR